MSLTADQNAAVADFWSKHYNEPDTVMNGMAQYGVNYVDFANAIGVTPEWFANWLNLNYAPQGFAGLNNSAIWAERNYNQAGTMNEVNAFIGVPLTPAQVSSINTDYTPGAVAAPVYSNTGSKPTDPNGPTFGGGAYAPSVIPQAPSGVTGPRENVINTPAHFQSAADMATSAQREREMMYGQQPSGKSTGVAVFAALAALLLGG